MSGLGGDWPWSLAAAIPVAVLFVIDTNEVLSKFRTWSGKFVRRYVAAIALVALVGGGVWLLLYALASAQVVKLSLLTAEPTPWSIAIAAVLTTQATRAKFRKSSNDLQLGGLDLGTLYGRLTGAIVVSLWLTCLEGLSDHERRLSALVDALVGVYRIDELRHEVRTVIDAMADAGRNAEFEQRLADIESTPGRQSKVRGMAALLFNANESLAKDLASRRGTRIISRQTSGSR